MKTRKNNLMALTVHMILLDTESCDMLARYVIVTGSHDCPCGTILREDELSEYRYHGHDIMEIDTDEYNQTLARRIADDLADDQEMIAISACATGK